MKITIETGAPSKVEYYDAINDVCAKAKNSMELVVLIQSQKQFLRAIFLKAGHADDPILNQLLELANAIDLG